MKQSESIATLAAALVAAQKEFAPAIKSATNDAFKKGGVGTKYVDLATAIEAAQPSLLSNGIAVIQGTSGDTERKEVSVTTRILHSSGEWIEDCLTLPAVNRGDYSAQSAGSAITYARRYSYMAILGFAPEDDDGDGASGKGPKQDLVPLATAKFITREQADAMRKVAKERGEKSGDVKGYNRRVREVLEAFGYTAMGEVTLERHQDVIDALEGL